MHAPQTRESLTPTSGAKSHKTVAPVATLTGEARLWDGLARVTSPVQRPGSVTVRWSMYRFANVRLLAAVGTLVSVILPGVSFAEPGEGEFTKRVVIQPGGAVYNPYLDEYCTLGFLLTDSAGALYGVTAGACAPNGRSRDGAGTYQPFVGARTWAPGTGPIVARNERKHRPYGRYVAQVLAEKADDLSYAIIRIDKGIAFNSTVAEARGPGGAPFSGQTNTPTEVTIVCMDGDAVSGFGVDGTGNPDGAYGYDDGVRRDVAPQGVQERTFRLATPAEGHCMGAPVLGFDNKAVAVHSGYLEGGQQSLLSGRVQGPPAYRMDAILKAAQQQLRSKLTLVQAGVKGTTRR